MHIACAADDRYLAHCAAMLHSLCSHNDPARLHVHFLYDDSTLRVEELKRLGDFVRQLGADFDPLPVGPELRKLFPDDPRFGRVAWYRILLPQLLPQLDRALYIDADAIVSAPLDQLWESPLGSHPVAAITDPLFPPASPAFFARLGLPGAGEYFNSGVLLLNLREWRGRGHTQALLEFIRRGADIDSWPDQNALNAVLWKERLKLPPRWNAMNRVFEGPAAELPYSTEEAITARDMPAIVHYVGPYKPWHYRCKHPRRELYFEHRRQIPWEMPVIEGRTLFQMLMRLLPTPAGIRLELRLYRIRAKLKRWFGAA